MSIQHFHPNSCVFASIVCKEYLHFLSFCSSVLFKKLSHISFISLSFHVSMWTLQQSNSYSSESNTIHVFHVLKFSHFYSTVIHVYDFFHICVFYVPSSVAFWILSYSRSFLDVHILFHAVVIVVCTDFVSILLCYNESISFLFLSCLLFLDLDRSLSTLWHRYILPCFWNNVDFFSPFFSWSDFLFSSLFDSLRIFSCFNLRHYCISNTLKLFIK